MKHSAARFHRQVVRSHKQDRNDRNESMKIEPILRSIVALRSSIPEDAFTAGTLGTQREGSGVVIRDGGLVLTIGYLITEAEEVWLTTGDGRVVPGHALAYDQETGFGLVQALAKLDLPALAFGDAAGAKIGDAVMLADGTGRSVEADIVARQEFAGYWEYLLDDAIFTAPAHPSWGGAALVDADGKLLGIGSLRLQMSRSGEIADINMVVPIDLLPPILDDLVKRGRVDKPPRPWLGAFSAESNGEVVVMSVSEDGPADRAGMRQGDVISDVRDSEVEGLSDFYRKLWASGPAGAEVPMRIVRDGRETWLRVKTADRSSFLRKPHLQ
jgi:S1-C subfamily serine protease